MNTLNKTEMELKNEMEKWVHTLIVNKSTIALDETSLFKNYLCGEEITKEDTPYKLSSLDLIQYFDLFLNAGRVDICKMMWESQEPKQALISLPSEKILAQSQCALSNSNTSFAEILWHENTSLKTLLTTSCDNTTIQFFKLALNNQCFDIAINMWEKNIALKAFFQNNDNVAASLEIFKDALLNRCDKITRSMWEFPEFKKQFLSSNDLKTGIDNFIIALQSRFTFIIDDMWKTSLKNAFTQTTDKKNIKEKLRLFKTVESTKNHKLSNKLWKNSEIRKKFLSKSNPKKGVDNFKLVLENHSIARDMWEIKHIQKQFISLENIQTSLAHFKLALDANFSPAINAMLDLDHIKQAYSQIDSITLKDFKSILNKKSGPLIIFLWSNNLSLRQQFINKDNNEALNREHFNLAMRSRCSELIEDLWKREELFSALQKLSKAETSVFFQDLFSSQCPKVIQPIWDALSPRADCVSMFKDKDMIKKVLASSKSGKSDFINYFLKNINDASLLTKIQKEINKRINSNKPTVYSTNQIASLQKRIDFLKLTQTSILENSDTSSIKQVKNTKKQKQKSYQFFKGAGAFSYYLHTSDPNNIIHNSNRRPLLPEEPNKNVSGIPRFSPFIEELKGIEEPLEKKLKHENTDQKNGLCKIKNIFIQEPDMSLTAQTGECPNKLNFSFQK